MLDAILEVQCDTSPRSDGLKVKIEPFYFIFWSHLSVVSDFHSTDHANYLKCHNISGEILQSIWCDDSYIEESLLRVQKYTWLVGYSYHAFATKNSIHLRPLIPTYFRELYAESEISAIKFVVNHNCINHTFISISCVDEGQILNSS